MLSGRCEMRPRCKNSGKFPGLGDQTLGIALMNPGTSATEHQKASNLGKRTRGGKQNAAWLPSSQCQPGGAASTYQFPHTSPRPPLRKPQPMVGSTKQSACTTMVRLAVDPAQQQQPSPSYLGSPVVAADCYAAIYHAPTVTHPSRLKTWEELVDDVSYFPKDDPLRRLIDKNVTHDHAMRFESNTENTTLNCKVNCESLKTRISETLKDRLKLPSVDHPSGSGSYTRLWITQAQDTCGFPKYMEVEAWIDSSLNKKRIPDGCHVVIGRDTLQVAVQKRLRDRAWDNMCMFEKAKGEPRESLLTPQSEGRRESRQPSPLLNPQSSAPELPPPTLGSPRASTIEVSPQPGRHFGDGQHHSEGHSFPGYTEPLVTIRIANEGDEPGDDEASSKRPRLEHETAADEVPLAGNTDLYGGAAGMAVIPAAATTSNYLNTAEGVVAGFDSQDAAVDFSFWDSLQRT